MLRINRDDHSAQRLAQKDLTSAGLKERNDLQQMIRTSPEEFFAEMAEPLLLIGEEIKPSGNVEDRIDLLAIDLEGALVVLELNRGTDKFQLLQAISYAAMVSSWDVDRIIGERQTSPGAQPRKRQTRLSGLWKRAWTT